MEVKLIFRNFKKIFSLNIENSNYVRAFIYLKAVVKNIINTENFELYWKDKDNDYIYFDTGDEFGLAIDLNKNGIGVYVHDKTIPEFSEKCSECTEKFHYVYQCLHCTDLILCKTCFDRHNKKDVHFGILEKSMNFHVHPFLYRELKTIIEGDIQEKNIINIGSYFQKLIGTYGVSFKDEITNEEPTPIFSPDNTEGNFTLENLNLSTPEKNSEQANIDEALNRMLSMGFNNQDDWIRKKLIEFNGDISQTLDWINRQVGINKTP